MYKKIVITNRHLCKKNFLDQIEYLCQNYTNTIILREKDMLEKDYELLAKRVIDVCKKNNAECILHTFIDVAINLEHNKIHLPLGIALKNKNKLLDKFETIGISTHSKEEVEIAEALGATYITYSHIFETTCKEGLKPKGLENLAEICNFTKLPVYGLGGITEDKISDVINHGAKGVCVMSSAMIM